MYWTFINHNDGDEVTVEAEGFDEACNIMFGDDTYDYHLYELSESSETEPQPHLNNTFSLHLITKV